MCWNTREEAEERTVDDAMSQKPNCRVRWVLLNQKPWIVKEKSTWKTVPLLIHFLQSFPKCATVWEFLCTCKSGQKWGWRRRDERHDSQSVVGCIARSRQSWRMCVCDNIWWKNVIYAYLYKALWYITSCPVKIMAWWQESSGSELSPLINMESTALPRGTQKDRGESGKGMAGHG